MVFCPNCGAENNDTAKFCKNCGNLLSGGNPIKDNYIATGNVPSAKTNDNSNFNNNSSNSNSGADKKNLIIICLTIAICAIIIAGAMVLFSNNDNDDNSALSDSISLGGGADNSINEPVENSATTDDAKTSAVAEDSSTTIQRGSFSTGNPSSDKTHCTIYVGSEHAGEKVKISVLYSNDGYALNKGKVVPKTVGSDGSIKVASANALKHYPDEAYITLYDNDEKVLDTKTVSLHKQGGKQTFR